MGALSKMHLECREWPQIRQFIGTVPGALPGLGREASPHQQPPAEPGRGATGTRGGSGSRRPGAPSAGLAQPHWARRLRAPPPDSVVIMAAAGFAVPRVKQKAGATRRGSEERG